MNRFVALCALFVTVSANGYHHHGGLIGAPHYGAIAHSPYAVPSLHGPLLHGHGHLAAPAISHSAITGDYSKVATVSGLAPGLPVAPVIRSVHAPLIGGHHAPYLAGHPGLLSPHGHLASPLAHGHGHLAAPYLSRHVLSPYASYAAPYAAYGHHGLHSPLLAGPHGHSGLLAPHGFAHGAHLIKK